MQKEITVAIISAAAAVVTTLLGKIPIENVLSSRMRRGSKIPGLVETKWDAQWYKPDGTLFAKDIVTFAKWTKDSRFEGYGEVTWDQKQFKYSIAGEIAPNKIIVLTYKAENFPIEPNIGIACLQLSAGQRDLDGYWVAHSDEVHALVPAKLTMKRIK